MYLDPLHSALILTISVRSWTTIGAAATGNLRRWDNHLSGSLTNCSNGLEVKTPGGDEEYIYHIDIYRKLITIDPDFADAPNPSRSSFVASAALEVEDQDSIGLCCKVFLQILITMIFDHDHVDYLRDRGIQTEPRPSLLRQLCLCFLSNQVRSQLIFQQYDFKRPDKLRDSAYALYWRQAE